MTPRRALVVLGVVALLVAHVVLLHHLSSQIALPMEVVLAVITIVVLVHLGVFRALGAKLHGRNGER